jgi:hypothetical protein
LLEHHRDILYIVAIQTTLSYCHDPSLRGLLLDVAQFGINVKGGWGRKAEVVPVLTNDVTCRIQGINSKGGEEARILVAEAHHFSVGHGFQSIEDDIISENSGESDWYERGKKEVHFDQDGTKKDQDVHESIRIVLYV